MKDNNNTIDLGVWSIPTSWDDITLKTYQDIERYYSDKETGFDIREVLHIITNHSKDEINALPMEFGEEIMEKLMFLQDRPNMGEPTNNVVIDGETYMVKTMERLKVGENLAADTIVKSDPHNYAAIMAILCRKDNEVYNSRFEAEVLEKRIEMFEKQPVTKIMPIISFFLTCYTTSVLPIQLSIQAKEAINLTRKHIETSARNGEVSRRSMKSAMKKLNKLEKSLSSI